MDQIIFVENGCSVCRKTEYCKCVICNKSLCSVCVAKSEDGSGLILLSCFKCYREYIKNKNTFII